MEEDIFWKRYVIAAGTLSQGRPPVMAQLQGRGFYPSRGWAASVVVGRAGGRRAADPSERLSSGDGEKGERSEKERKREREGISRGRSVMQGRRKAPLAFDRSPVRCTVTASGREKSVTESIFCV